jgi:fatty-acyl-CoA synthase
MTNPYEQDLDRQPANFQPLTPITLLERAARTYPDHPAIVHGARRTSYRDFWRRSLQLARHWPSAASARATR